MMKLIFQEVRLGKRDDGLDDGGPDLQSAHVPRVNHKAMHLVIGMALGTSNGVLYDCIPQAMEASLPLRYARRD